jgi:flagellar biosynthesis/type III secretory pathway protein FliH
MEKFKFDLEFTDGGEVRQGSARAKRSYRPEEVAALCAQARTEGVAEAERRAAQSLAELAKGIHEVLSMARLALDDLHDDATRLAGTIARKLASHAFEAAPEGYFERTIADCLNLVQREPEIRISLPPSATPSLRSHLEKLRAMSGLKALVRIEDAPELAAAACRLDWQTGGAEISLEKTLAQMDALIEERIAALKTTRTAERETSRAAS